MTVCNTIGGRIEQARIAKGFNPSQLARRMAVKVSTLQNWESDRSAPRADKLTKLSGVLQVPLIWLMSGETPKHAGRSLELPETSEVAQKLERAIAMQQELAALLIDVSADVARLQRVLDEEEVLAA